MDGITLGRIYGLGVVWARWRIRKNHLYNYHRKHNNPCTPLNSSIMCWKPNTLSEIWNRFRFEYQNIWPGFDYYLWMDYHNIVKIPAKYYYSAYFENYKELDYPICLFNQIELISLREDSNVFLVKPGITGLAQVKGIDMSNPKKLALTDSYMISEYNQKNYFKYLFLTLFGRGIGDKIKY